jgi:Ca2+-binding RTX toxin-like protein
VQVLSNYAYVADEFSGLQIINISNPTAPTFVGNYNTSGKALGVQVLGNYAYVADEGSGLKIINISDPVTPALAGAYNTSGYAYGVQVLGNYAYVADDVSGLQIINISNPAAPTLAGNYNTSGNARGVQVVGNYAYVADGGSGLQIINISNPTAPTLVGTYNTSGIAYGVQVVGNYVYVADDVSGLQIINISNPAAPTLAGTYDNTFGNTYGVQVVGNYAYLADRYSGLKIIDVSDFNSPTNITLSTNNVAENQAIGTAVGTLITTDPNPGDTFTYSLVSGTGSTDNALFSLVGYQLQTNSLFDFETQNSYSIRVRTTDPSGITFEKAFTISVTDLPNLDLSTTALTDTINASNGDNNTLTTTFADLQQNDNIKGGLSIDTLILSGGTSTDELNIDANSNTNQLDILGSTITNFERFDLSGFLGTVSILGFNTSSNWIKTGSGKDDLTGGNTNDTLNGGTGADILFGLQGNDTYIVDNIGDVIAEVLNAGIDSVESSVTWTLRINIENLTLTGTTAINGTGNSLNNVITGNSANNSLNGGAGNDSLLGGDSNDILQGTKSGKGEQDYLNGGSGSDKFILGDSTWIGYDDGLTDNAGTNDYAEIADFNTAEDVIQIQSGLNYLLNVVGEDTQLLIDKPNTEPDELIAIIKNQTGLSITDSYFVYNQSLPSISLAVDPASVTEDSAINLVYTFTRTGPTTNALTVNYNIAGTADSSDYTGATPGTGKAIAFAAGSSTATLTIVPTADTTIESDETVALTLETGTDYTIGTINAVTGTITNDDLPTLAINDITVVEGQSPNALLNISLSSPVNQTITVNYTTSPVNATANLDYTSQTGTITIAPNSSFATLSIPILNDNTNEGDETFIVTLSNPVNAILDTNASVGEVIITDTLQSGITRTLPTNVENLKLIGTAAINGTGNNGNNVIAGNSANNSLNGLDGNDDLNGDAGNDFLTGGLGVDILTGGAGSDKFIYSNFNDSLLATTDRIRDFNPAQGDRIGLNSLPQTAYNAGIVTASNIRNAIATVFADANVTTAGSQPLGANQAVFFTYGATSLKGTYLVVNDGLTAFDETKDLFINMTGLTGTIPLGSLTVNNYFTV